MELVAAAVARREDGRGGWPEDGDVGGGWEEDGDGGGGWEEDEVVGVARRRMGMLLAGHTGAGLGCGRRKGVAAERTRGAVAWMRTSREGNVTVWSKGG